MTPKSDGDSLEAKASFRSKLKGLFGKPFSKTKKCKTNHCDLTFDALPDFPKQANDSQVKENHNETDAFNNFNENKETYSTHCPEDTKTQFKKEEDCKEEKNNSLPKYNEKGFKKNSKENSPVLSQTSVVVNGGVGIHIGSVFNNVNNLYYNGFTPKSESVNRVEKTEAIKDLLKNENKIEPAHLEFLSSHFGENWQEIGVTLGLTVGELHCVKNQKKKLKERAFQMLMLWSQKTGADAKLGDLCKLLWRGKVDTAREAVKQLSLNIDLFQ